MKNLTVTEQINYPWVWLSAHYYGYALQVVEDALINGNISVREADWLKVTVFRKLFQYYILFFPIYTFGVCIILLSGVVLGILHTITFKKIPIFISIYSKLNILTLIFHTYTLKTEYQAQFISEEQYSSSKKSLVCRKHCR